MQAESTFQLTFTSADIFLIFSNFQNFNKKQISLAYKGGGRPTPPSWQSKNGGGGLH